MKNLTKTILTVLATGLISCAVFSQQAQAVLITGQVDMSGIALLDNPDLALATSASFPTGASVLLGTGAYTGTEGSSVTWASFSWNPPSTPVSPLWTFMFGGQTYSFQLLSLTVVEQTSDFLNLTGTGIMSITGGVYDDTFGDWSFTIQDSGGPNPTMRFVFGSSTAAIPDGGSAVALLGVALAGVEVLRRKFARK